jgi:trk system potassium uptake protein
VNFSSFSLIKNLNKSSKQFAVIGLGRFGRAVCQTLHEQGYEVLGTDIDEKLVADALNSKIAVHTLQLDSTEPSALAEAGIFEFDTVIVAIGNFLQESIITTLNLKEGGVSKVVSKASTEVHGKLLKRVGADLVVFPEFEAGCTLARSLTKPSILDRFDLDPEHSIVELLVPEEFHDRTLAELELRNKYGLNVLAVGEENKLEINPSFDKRLWKGAVMVVIGDTKDIDRLPI